MPLELKPGVILPIPCRNCGKITKYIMKPGSTLLRCKACDHVTGVVVEMESGTWTVKTGLIATGIPTI